MPLVETSEDGTVRIYNNEGKLHKSRGPAIKDPNGYEAWYKLGSLHRLTGPAITYSDGRKEWWVNGKQIWCKTQEEFEGYLRVMGISTADEPLILGNGVKIWTDDDTNELHREDGPAVIMPDGRVEWWYLGRRIPVDNLEQFKKYISMPAFW